MAVAKRKCVVVTGGASGIGLAMTRYFAEKGHTISILDVDSAQGLPVVAEVGKDFPASNIEFEKCDVSDWENQADVFKSLFNRHGVIDIVMANAGISERGRSDMTVLDENIPSKPRTRVVDVNLVGVMNTVKLAAYYMNKNPASDGISKGTIICTASNAGIYPFPIAPVYSATKAGVIGLVRSLARPYAAVGIQINALAPAVLETNIAPDKALFKNMILTPFSTLTRGVAQLLDDLSLSGTIVEVHGEQVTVRAPPEFVDEDSAKNLEEFWSLGYA